MKKLTLLHSTLSKNNQVAPQWTISPAIHTLKNSKQERWFILTGIFLFFIFSFNAIPAFGQDNYTEIRKSAEAGVIDAQLKLGLMYLNGNGVAQNNFEAVKWIRKAAEQGNADAQFYLGLGYATGIGVLPDEKEAFKWFKKAAEQGHAKGQKNLGIYYFYGRSVPQDDKEAFFWFRKSGEQGEPIAEYNIGYLYFHGRGVPQDDKEAFFWFRKAAEHGMTLAQYNLGVMYFNGRGVPQSDIEALKWIKKAAEKGVSEAQNYLGVFYQNGKGVPQDYIEAEKWYRKSAEQGNALAQSNLGYMYMSGLGVIQDDYEAAKWFKKSADQGNQVAKHNLDIMQKQGRLPEIATSTPPSAEQIFEKIKPSIVVIIASTSGSKKYKLGSGIVTKKEVVVTNCHVLEEAKEIKVMQDDDVYNATLKYADLQRDLCQLNVSGLKSPPVVQRTSKDLKVGTHVYAVGSPKGLELTLSEGIISGLRDYEGTLFIQTTASISPGSSGGGLFDGYGRLVGITTFQLKEGQNINFALPADWLSEIPSRAMAQKENARFIKISQEKNKKQGELFLKNNKKKLGIISMSSGLQCKILREGYGKTPKGNNIVKIQYRGLFIDGTEFVNSYQKGKGVEFEMQNVIAGWREALLKMKIGAKWRLFIPPHLAFGGITVGENEEIPAYSTLIFDLELIGIK